MVENVVKGNTGEVQAIPIRCRKAWRIAGSNKGKRITFFAGYTVTFRFKTITLLQPILALILVRYLRKALKKRGALLKWGLTFTLATIVCIVLIVLNVALNDRMGILKWIGHAFILSIVIIIYYKQEFHFAKPTLYSMLPLILVSWVESLILLFFNDLNSAWNTIFFVAGFFAFVWLIAMTIINNKQQKALEIQRLKTEAIERENNITASLKAALEVQVSERTAALTLQTEELQKALEDLKSAQSQLIQSEKMASLGELTAGIAHEIQNPLNFVNNFSEVNKELVDEMQQELKAGKIEDAIAISNDIRANEEKINQHGKRADAIVKGMLQHSRSSSAVKEPTNINALADEYLRLAYHGLRAKDKSFNATMKTDFDETIGNINIIPQDMGRVILNLITNAFYAASPPTPQGGISDPAKNNNPTVWVKTSKIPPSGGGGAAVLISVRDNGPGIPKKILDKIFQPFFTTKPTGQGTGLGLSMSYDIVTKVHGGTLNVKTKEGEGTEFIISLPV